MLGDFLQIVINWGIHKLFEMKSDLEKFRGKKTTELMSRFLSIVKLK